MADFFNQNGVRIINADVIEGLKSLPDGSVNMVVTSPPYLSHREYPGEPSVWLGDKPLCTDEHNWIYTTKTKKRRSLPPEPNDGHRIKNTNSDETGRGEQEDVTIHNAYCSKCNANLCFLGQENSVEEYCQHLVLVAREIKRCLHKTGVFWINCGDAFAGSGGAHKSTHGNPGISKSAKRDGVARNGFVPSGLKERDLIGVPWRVALALQSDGWYLRTAAPWEKRSAMPESVTNRPQQCHEYWFMLTKSPKYWFDMDSVHRSHSTATLAEIQKASKWGIKKEETSKPNVENYTKHDQATGRTEGNLAYIDPLHTAAYHPLGRGWRTTDFFFDSLDEMIEQQTEWLAHLLDIRDHGGMMISDDGLPLAMVFNTEPFTGEKYIEGVDHFAAFPSKMIKPLILSSCPQFVCSQCGAPHVRRVEKRPRVYADSPNGTNDGTNNKEPYSENNPHRERLRADSDTAYDKKNDNAGRLATYRQSLRYNSKYADESNYGQPLQAFQRENSLAGGREQSRIDAQKLYPDNIYAQKLYVHFIHEHGEQAKEAAVEYVASELWKKSAGADSNGEYHGEAHKDFDGNGVQNASDVKRRILAGMGTRKTVEWVPSCTCGAPSKRGVVLDPFLGSGTAVMVATQLGRDGWGIERSQEYCALARARIIANSQLEMI